MHLINEVFKEMKANMEGLRRENFEPKQDKQRLQIRWNGLLTDVEGSMAGIVDCEMHFRNAYIEWREFWEARRKGHLIIDVHKFMYQ